MSVILMYDKGNRKTSDVNFKYDKKLMQFNHLRYVKRPELMKRIGQRIVDLRTKKGWNQSDLARACSKDRQAIEKLENGRVNPTLFTLHEIASALEVTLSELVKL